jgi:hypothetical protein
MNRRRRAREEEYGLPPFASKDEDKGDTEEEGESEEEEGMASIVTARSATIIFKQRVGVRGEQQGGKGGERGASPAAVPALVPFMSKSPSEIISSVGRCSRRYERRMEGCCV